MTYYDSKIIKKVKEMDLLTYLMNYEPEELVPFCKDTYVTRTHDSLKINNGMWYWFSRGIGGKSALEYLISVKNYSFIQAVETILEHTNESPPSMVETKKKEQIIEFVLPPKDINNDRIKSYLMSRGIDEAIIQECIDNELIYQQLKSKNVVFVGYDKYKKPRYAMLRGTNQSRFMQEVEGSHKAFSFNLESIDVSDSVHLFESAIDLLSYATLMNLENKEWYKENLVSLAGVYKPNKEIEKSKVPIALMYFLNQHQNVKTIYLHFDNDSVGRLATKALQTIMPKEYKVIDEPPLIGKDFNDFLCEKIKINNKKIFEKER